MTASFGETELEEAEGDIKNDGLSLSRRLDEALYKKPKEKAAIEWKYMRDKDVVSRGGEMSKILDTYQLLFENSMDAIIFGLPDGRIIQANPVACDLFRMTQEELCAFGRDWILDRDDPRFIIFMEERERLGKARGELTFIRKDRSTFEGEITGILQDDGQRVVIIVRDITERKKKEEALRESEERFRNMADNAPVIIWVSDPEGRCTSLNKNWCEFTGQASEAGLGIGWLNAVHPDDASYAYNTHIAAYAKRNPVCLEYRLRRRDGEYRWCIVSATPRFGPKGEFFGYVGSVIDINDHKILEETIDKARIATEDATQAKSHFLASMSHEIRTPLTVVMAAIELLQGMDDNPERCELLQMANNSAEHLHGLINDILDFSKMEAKKMDVRKEPFDLLDCVRKATDMFILSAQNKGLTIQIEAEKRTPQRVIGDPDRLGQILVNLVGNAIKFTYKGEVHISIKSYGDLIEFAVADTGIGIPEEKKNLLFAPFTQVDGSLTRNFGGTGLGLAICKGLVELMGGDISFTSEEGRGSTFTFSLPLENADPKIIYDDKKPSHDSEEGIIPARILLAEDDPVVQNVILMLLESYGWQAERAASGMEALEKWESNNFDLILMDLQMPNLNGLEATRIIREKETEGGKNTIIIGLTAHVQYEIRKQCMEAGMDKVITKPVQGSILHSVIESCFSVKSKGLIIKIA